MSTRVDALGPSPALNSGSEGRREAQTQISTQASEEGCSRKVLSLSLVGHSETTGAPLYRLAVLWWGAHSSFWKHLLR